MAKKNNEHYVDNAKFSAAVLEYVTHVNECHERGEQTPIVPDYIASCFLKIGEGLSYKTNFVRYTFREEMVMDAVENCLKAIRNYNIDYATRTGKPNAFSYFTQISWYAFLRRIQKESKQQDIKLKYLAESGLEEFMVNANEDAETSRIIQSFVDNLKRRIEDVKDKDTKVEDYKASKPRRRRSSFADSDLAPFFNESYEDGI